jgi:hypothetical protein
MPKISLKPYTPPLDDLVNMRCTGFILESSVVDEIDVSTSDAAATAGRGSVRSANGTEA